MGLTNFPFGITSFGIPVLPGIPVPYTGKYFFVDPVNGLDGNAGTSAAQAFKTLSRAHLFCTDGHSDVVFLIGNGQTSGTARESSTLIWSKNATHLIGVAAPGEVAQRARIATTAGVNFTPLVQVTGSGCHFSNLEAFHGYATASAQICWLDSGQRNVYDRVNFAGMGNTTAAAQTGGRSLVIDGGAGQTTPTTGYGEHIFRRCTIGIDTVTRSAANYTMEIQNGAPRIKFVECLFPCLTSAATAGYLTIGASGIDRWITMEKCLFINAVKSGGTTMTQGFVLNAAIGGLILLNQCTSVGATKYETTPTNQVYVDSAAASATSGLALNNT